MFTKDLEASLTGPSYPLLQSMAESKSWRAATQNIITRFKGQNQIDGQTGSTPCPKPCVEFLIKGTRQILDLLTNLY